ncbi:MAG: c-type cytochrome [Pedobacter sp.]|uniref:c-type cytochrome n=1 Tax=Pedobacter sp. TaxID=1411316 RepID=UPI00339B78FA
MKHTTLLILGCLGLTIASCGGSSQQEETIKTKSTTTTTTDSSTTVSAEPTGAELPGKKLVAMADCVGCHNETQKVIGPAYVDIAAKYPSNEANISHLADVVIAGSKGTWGDLPMTPHPNLSKDDAKLMVTWVLSLKK